MKKLLLLPICFFSFCLLKAQTNETGVTRDNWFASFVTGYSIGGPKASFNNALNDQYYNLPESSFFGTINYPITGYKMPVLFMAGKKISKYGSLYVVAGQSNGGKAQGYNGTNSISFDYSVLQFTFGYQLSFPNTHFKVGLGPGLLVFKNNPSLNYQSVASQSSTVPAATINVRVPFGPEKKLFGIELFFQLNIAPSVKMNEIVGETSVFQTTTINMSSAIIGIAFAFRG